jgi:hypothetical protein
MRWWAYLNKIGLPYSAVVYITSASPDSIKWLSKPDAEKLGIEVSLFNTPLTFKSSASRVMQSGAAPRVSTSTSPSTGAPVLPTSISPKYSTESDGEARMHTCVDQYIANKATNSNGGMKWVEKGGGYYSECNKRLKG